MILLLIGLVFVGAAVAVGVDVWRENSTNARLTVHAFGHTFSQPPWAVIVVGTVCGALIVLGLVSLYRGAAARRRLAGERRAAFRERDRLLRQSEADRAAREQAERDRAEATAEVERARVAAQSAPGPSATSPPAY